jgi:hypothetical protein
MKCASCGEEHELLEPTFRRPDAVVSLASEERAARVKEGDDLCVLRAASIGAEHRGFVRCVLPVSLLDAEESTRWGLWAEVARADFHRIVETWSDPGQSELPAMEATIANRVPGYPETLGLPVTLRLTGPTTRPSLAFGADSIHPFALECRRGVCVHRVMEWLASIRR